MSTNDNVSEGSGVGFAGTAMSLTISMESGHRAEAQILLEQILKDFPELAEKHGYHRDTIKDWDKEVTAKAEEEANLPDLTEETEEAILVGDNDEQ